MSKYIKNTQNIKDAIRNIGLALNASHNTTATDLREVLPIETSWRIDHTNEIKDLEFLAGLFNIDNCL